MTESKVEESLDPAAMTDQEGKIIEDNPIGTGLDAFRASFRSVCQDANVRPTRDALNQLGYISMYDSLASLWCVPLTTVQASKN